MRLAGKSAITLLLLCSVVPVFATTFIMPTDTELIGKSGAIVRGTVLSSKVEVNLPRVETVYEVRIEKVLKGRLAVSEVIKVASPGGAFKDKILVVPGSAQFEDGEPVLLFLTEGGSGWQVTDMALGKFKPMKGDGERVLIREIEPTDDLGFGVIGNRDGVRSEAKFLRFIEKVVAGQKAVQDYLVAPSALTPVFKDDAMESSSSKVVANVAPFTAQSYTQVGAAFITGVRWRASQMSSSGVTFSKRASTDIGGLPASDGGVVVLQGALNAWTNECGSAINLPMGPETAVVAQAQNPATCGICDEINVVEFNDPQNLVLGSFSSSGTVAVTFLVFDGSDGDAVAGFRRIYDADIVFQDGYLGTNASFQTAMTHEVGHGIGWRHSSADPSSPNAQTVTCTASVDCTPTNTAIMFFNANGGFNFTLQPWDVNAAQAVYPAAPGSCAPPPPPSFPKGDFSRDGKSDIVWRSYGPSGLNLIWTMNGAIHTQTTFLPDITDTNWRLEASGDFNADGHQDLAWRNYSSGLNVMWFLNGTSFDQWAFFPDVADLNWHIQGAGDFDSDGKADIVWRNYATGQNSVWYMNGAILKDGVFLPTVSNLNFEIGAVNDFNNDGKADLVWRNYSNGQNLIWFMNNTVQSSFAFFPDVANTSFRIQGTGEFNGDGKADILWRNVATGQNTVWLMNGANLIDGLFLESVGDLAFQIAGAR